jgi:hypothetical protein
MRIQNACTVKVIQCENDICMATIKGIFSAGEGYLCQFNRTSTIHRPRLTFHKRPSATISHKKMASKGKDYIDPRCDIQALLDSVTEKLLKMAPAQKTQQPQQLLFVDGTFEELAKELAEYINVGDKVQPLLEKNAKKEEVLGELIRASDALLSVPEKEFVAAANLVIYLVLQSDEPKNFLPALCGTFSKPITTSPINGVGLNLHALTTIFNLIEPENPIRYNVFKAILRFLKSHGMFDTLRPYLKNLPGWLEDWGTGEEFQRQLYEEIAELAAESGEDEYVNFPRADMTIQPLLTRRAGKATSISSRPYVPSMPMTRTKLARMMPKDSPFVLSAHLSSLPPIICSRIYGRSPAYKT